MCRSIRLVECGCISIATRNGTIKIPVTADSSDSDENIKYNNTRDLRGRIMLVVSCPSGLVRSPSLFEIDYVSATFKASESY